MIAALIALIALLMLGGSAGTGWAAELEKPIKHFVADEGRRDSVLDAVDTYEEGMENTGESVKDHFIQLLETHINFQSSEKDFDAVALKLKQDQEKTFVLDLALHKEMKNNVSKDEWAAVFSKEK